MINAKGEEVLLQKRMGIKALSRERIAEKIIEQLQKRKFRMYCSFSAKAVQLMYRIFPQLTLNILRHYRMKISSMQ
jgi:short-subunit dehydrogenase